MLKARTSQIDRNSQDDALSSQLFGCCQFRSSGAITMFEDLLCDSPMRCPQVVMVRFEDRTRAPGVRTTGGSGKGLASSSLLCRGFKVHQSVAYVLLEPTFLAHFAFSDHPVA